MDAVKPRNSLHDFVEKLRHLAQALLAQLQKFGKFLKKSWHRFCINVGKAWRKFMRKFTRWIDPKLNPYRPTPRPTAVNLATDETKIHISRQNSPEDVNNTKESDSRVASTNHVDHAPISAMPDIPRSRADLLEIIQSAPLAIFDQHERELMTAALNLPVVPASEIMQPKSKIVYVQKDEMLGPLTLDRLYRSGFAHFPVQDEKGNIIGAIHTTHLNNLEIRDSTTAEEILDPGIYYIREDYPLEEVLNTFLRTNSYFFLVVDQFGQTTGILTFKDFCHYLFGERPHDSFERDNDNLAVAKRSLPLRVSNQSHNTFTTRRAQ